MKRALVAAAFLSFAFCFMLAVGSQAATYRQSLESHPMGDADLNGVVSSADARCILRSSVGKEELSETAFYLSDTDGDGIITAADSRITLRTDVGLEEVHYHSFKAATPGGCTFVCTECGYSFTDEKCEHVYVVTKMPEHPACMGESEKIYTCKYCDAVKKEIIPKTEHSFNGGTVTVKATCAASGVKEYVCGTCGYKKYETLPKLPQHSYDKGVVTKAPTCKNTGIKVYTCTGCSGKKTEVLPKTSDHKLIAQTVISPATCVAEGKMLYVCKVCGDLIAAASPKTAHKFSKAAGGIKRCAFCGYMQTEGDVTAFYITVGGKDIFMGETIEQLTDTFGKYTGIEHTIKGLTTYSFAGDYKNYFMAYFDGDKAVGYYVCASDFSNTLFKKGDAIRKNMKTDNVTVMPYFDSVHNCGVYAFAVMNDEYTFAPDMGRSALYSYTSKQIFDMTNAYRVQNGKSVLTWNSTIASLASEHCMDMAEAGFFEHVNSEGLTPMQRALRAGVDCVAFGENIAAGSLSPFVTFDQWVNSKVHNDTMLKDYYTVLGVGGGYNENSAYDAYWTQNFAELG